jgi:hypothetical protein
VAQTGTTGHKQVSGHLHQLTCTPMFPGLQVKAQDWTRTEVRHSPRSTGLVSAQYDPCYSLSTQPGRHAHPRVAFEAANERRATCLGLPPLD